MRTIIYSIAKKSDRLTLSTDLTMRLIERETIDKIYLHLSNGLTEISKYKYLNKDIILKDGSDYFYLCNKQVSRDYIFKKLLKYAESLLDNRISELSEKKELINRELNKPKLQRVAA